MFRYCEMHFLDVISIGEPRSPSTHYNEAALPKDLNAHGDTHTHTQIYDPLDIYCIDIDMLCRYVLCIYEYRTKVDHVRKVISNEGGFLHYIPYIGYRVSPYRLCRF